MEPKEPRAHKPTRFHVRPTGKLVGYFKRRATLRFTYKGHRYSARVGPDGVIRFAGKKYNSPSAAAKAIIKRGAADGWRVWKYERAPGDWVPIDELRRR